MEWLSITAALLLLAAPGLTFLLLVTPPGASSRIALVVGYGLLAGLVGVPIIVRFLDIIGLPLSFSVTAPSSLLAAGALYLIARRRDKSLSDLWIARSESEPSSRTAQLTVLLLMMLIAFRVVILAAEVAWRPLFPWDATMHWATKSRVWLEHLELRPFIENALWLKAESPDAYTDHHPGYPITVPLLQLWMTSALGYWDESLMNIPWVVCFIALGAAFYGQAREAGASGVMSMAFTYYLLSMPLLNTHVALAGYADMFLGACYCLAIMAFHNWTVSRDRFQAVLAIFFALSCPLIKNEGTFWLLTFIPALVVVFVPGRKSLSLLLILSLCAAAALFLFPRDVVVAGHSLNELRVFFRSAALQAVFEAFFIHDNWHLFMYLLTGLLVAAALFRRSVFAEVGGVTVALAAAIALFMFLFLFTAYSGGALRFTAVGRISLQLVPSGMFFCLLLYRALTIGPQPARAQRGSGVVAT